MRVPVLAGIIRRRLLVNFRAAPEVVRPLLPAGFHPKLQDGRAIVGICLIRLEEVRPKGFPAAIGLASENAAHRIAVEWESGGGWREGVFVPRRDTDSCLNALAGGRLFPGEQHRMSVSVEDDGSRVDFRARSADDSMRIEVAGETAEALPPGSCFESLDAASRFFESGCVGYSPGRRPNRLDGMELCVGAWRVRPFAVQRVASSFFEDRAVFPEGSVEFDHCLIMRDIPHEWRSVSGCDGRSKPTETCRSPSR